MKNSVITFIASIACVFLGSLLKINHNPNANLLLILGVILLLVATIMFFLNKKKVS